jgi:hypothetical protein
MLSVTTDELLDTFGRPNGSAFRRLHAFQRSRLGGGSTIRRAAPGDLRWSDAPTALIVLLWVTALWLWWVPVATVRFSVPTGDSLAGSWSEEASSIALGAVWGDLGVAVLLAVQWLMVPALAGILQAWRTDIGVSGGTGAALGAANNLPWVASQLLLVPGGVDARWGHAGVYLGPLMLAVPAILGFAAGLAGGGLGLLLRALGRSAHGAVGTRVRSDVATSPTLAWVIGTAGLLGPMVALVHVRSGLPVLPWAVAVIATRLVYPGWRDAPRGCACPGPRRPCSGFSRSRMPRS